ncbi:MAG: hypothetical protein M3176_00185 [Chloroflexota bacterium]|nr:hypothetical protein [Chloroflexota bacterium]
MAHVSSYSHITRANIPQEIWDEAWFTVQSWKSYLQSFPGFFAVRFSARGLDGGDIRFHVVTVWEYAEQLEEWLGSDWSAESLLKSLQKPAYDIDSETYEDIG